MTNKKWTRKEIDKVKFLKTFMTAKQVAEETGLSKNQVSYALYHVDLEPKKKAGLFLRWFPFLKKGK
jgi:glutamyl-tRNA reductase